MTKPHTYRVHDSEHISTPMELPDARTYAAFRVELHPHSAVRITHRGKTIETFGAKGKRTMAHTKKSRGKTERSPAQRAATKRMLAANRAARGGSSTKRKAKKGKAKKSRTTHSGGTTLASLVKTVHGHSKFIGAQKGINKRQTQINHTQRATTLKLTELYGLRQLPAPMRVHVRQLGSGRY